MNNEIQLNSIAKSILNPSVVSWKPITEERINWRPVLINTNRFKIDTISPHSPVSRALVHSNPQKFSATDTYIVLVSGQAPVVYAFDSSRETPIVFKTDDTDALIKNKRYLKLVYSGFMRLLDAEEVYAQNLDFMLEPKYIQPNEIDDDIPDEAVKKILWSLVHFTNFIRTSDSRKFIELPTIF